MPPYRNRVRARYRPYGRRGWKINQNRIPPGMEPVAGLGFMPGAVNRAFNTYFNKRNYFWKRLTTQYDRSNVYRKRRMPYRKKKNWVRFLKKIRAADKNNLGSLVKIINEFSSHFTPYYLTEQSVCAISLYGGSGTNAAETTGNRDMRDLIAEMVAGAGNTYNITNGAKFNFYSAVMDLTMLMKLVMKNCCHNLWKSIYTKYLIDVLHR